MKKHSLITRWVALGVILGISTLLTGCSTTSSLPSGSAEKHPEVAGKWAWNQEFSAPESVYRWQGEFVLEKEGDSYSGELSDSSEGTYGDTIKDVTVVNDQISFTRQGRFGTQQWKGTLKKEDGKLMVVEGQWTKGGGIAGIWSAHKID